MPNVTAGNLYLVALDYKGEEKKVVEFFVLINKKVWIEVPLISLQSYEMPYCNKHPKYMEALCINIFMNVPYFRQSIITLK